MTGRDKLTGGDELTVDFRAAVDGLASHRTVLNTQSYLRNGRGWIGFDRNNSKSTALEQC